MTSICAFPDAVLEDVCEDILEHCADLTLTLGTRTALTSLPNTLDMYLYRTVLQHLQDFSRHQLLLHGIKLTDELIEALAKPLAFDHFYVETYGPGSVAGYRHPPSRHHVAVFVLVLDAIRVTFPLLPEVPVTTYQTGTLLMFPYDPLYQYVVTPVGDTHRAVVGEIRTVGATV